MKRFKAKLVKVEDFSDSVKCFKFSSEEGIDFEPGQFVTATVITGDGRTKRSYSIASVPRGKEFELCIKKVPEGLGTRFFWELEEGDEVEFIGPLGNFTVKNRDNDLVFISAGTGIAPFVPMISNLLESGFGNKIVLLKGFRDENEIIYDKHFRKLADKYENFNFYNVLSRSGKSSENVGYVQDFVEKYLPEGFNGDFYVCGVKEMVEEVKKKLLSLGFSESQIFVERY